MDDKPLQSEAILEQGLLQTLKKMKYQRVHISSGDALEANFRLQLEQHNAIKLSDEEFKRVLIHLAGGDIFDKSKKLRDKYELLREDGTVRYLEFINKKDWCRNVFQVANQVTDKGKEHCRYDVVLLINGLPLVLIELKKRGQELKTAYEQIRNVYMKRGLSGLFAYVQLFVVSNGVHTRYFAHNPKSGFEYAFRWSDKANVHTDRLEDFAQHFFEHCVLGKILAKYIVLHESSRSLMALRPYQYYAVEELLSQVQNTNHNGYVWHTTGSGKTLTSFKSAELIAELSEVYKVLFVVDRHDLDTQTKKEYNAFSPDCVKDIDNTDALVRELVGSARKRIITTIQKLNKAVSTLRYRKELESVKDENIVLIFDECHRSQFGEMHANITRFFGNVRYFGFTGTPILSVNANGMRTTADIFGKRLHTYTIKNAIADENVLGFLVEYYGSWRRTSDDTTEISSINTRELMEAPYRIAQNVGFIADNYAKSTYQGDFNAMLATAGIPMLLKYYEAFKQIDHRLKIAAIFSIGNTPEVEGEGVEADSREQNTYRDRLDAIIEDYNRIFGTNCSSNAFAEYYDDVAERMRKREIDLLIVSDMFLTGFDAKRLNTLYVDKNLRHHGLIQAFSRTNRVLNSKKRFGKVVCFRSLAEEVDEAILMYSDEHALEVVKMDPYEKLFAQFEEEVRAFLFQFGRIRSQSDFAHEEEKLQFVRLFRSLLRLLNRMRAYSEHDENGLPLTPQAIADFTSIYLDLRPPVTPSPSPERASVVDDVDFELELLRRDLINAHYIIELLKGLKPKAEDYQTRRKAILEIVEQDPALRPKRELIDEFIASTIDHAESFDPSSVGEDLDAFFLRKRGEAIDALAHEESVAGESLHAFVRDYDYLELEKPELLDEALQGGKLGERRRKRTRLVDGLRSIIRLFDFK